MRSKLLLVLPWLAFLVVALAIHPALRDPDLTKRSLWLALAPCALLLGFRELRRGWNLLPRVTRLLLIGPLPAFLLSALWNDAWQAGLERCAWYADGVGIALLVAGMELVRRKVLLHGLAIVCGAIGIYATLESARLVPSVSSVGREASGGAPFAFSGNVAKTAEVLLPGAFLTLALFLRVRSPWRWVYVPLHVSCILALSQARTLTGLIVYCASAVVVAFLLSEKATLARREKALGLSLLAVGALVLVTSYTGVLRTAESRSTTHHSEIEVSDRVTGEVRWRIYGSILGDAFLAHPFLGFGPGRFAEEYPPHRDPIEADLSRPASPAEGPYQITQVDTAHSDPLEILADSGALGFLSVMLAATALLGLAFRRALSTSPLLSVPLLAVLLNSLARSPLLDNAASSALFAMLLGSCLGIERDERRSTGGATPWALLAFLLASGFGFLAGARGVGSDIQTLRFTAARMAGQEPPIAWLEDALAWKPSRWETRSLLARTHLSAGDPVRALEQARRGLEDAPHSIELIGREADALLRLAERATELGERERLLDEYRERQRRILELDPGLEAVRRNLRLAEELAEALPFLRRAKEIEEAFLAVEEGLRRGVPNEPENALEELRLTLPRDPDLAAWRASWMARLEAIAREAGERGRYLVMRNAYEVLIAIAEQPAERALQIGEALHRASLEVPEGSEPERFTRSYASYFTIQGHERHLVAALDRGDAESATERLDRLLAYPEYKERPWFQLDAAAVAQIGGKATQADIFLELALTELEVIPDFQGLPASRRVYLQVFRGSPHLPRLQRLFERG